MLSEFDVGTNNSHMQVFCNTFNFGNLFAEPTYYKNSKNSFFIDLIFTNRPCSFQKSCVFEADLSNFHRMTVNVTKNFQKQSRIINYKDYEKFGNDNFREGLLFRLAVANTEANSTIFLTFFEICHQAINHHVHCIQKYVRHQRNYEKN